MVERKRLGGQGGALRDRICGLNSRVTYGFRYPPLKFTPKIGPKKQRALLVVCVVSCARGALGVSIPEYLLQNDGPMACFIFSF